MFHFVLVRVRFGRSAMFVTYFVCFSSFITVLTICTAGGSGGVGGRMTIMSDSWSRLSRSVAATLK
jgi:hypothetical protein